MNETGLIKAQCIERVGIIDCYNPSNEPTFSLKISDGNAIEVLLGEWAIRYSNENDYRKSDLCIDLRWAIQHQLNQSKE